MGCKSCRHCEENDFMLILFSFQSMEKEDKSNFEFSAVESTCMKYTSFGIAFDEIDRQKLKARKDLQTMELTIAEMIASAAEKNGKSQFIFFVPFSSVKFLSELKSLEFIFVSASFFVTTLDGDIFPAEIAMSKFSLLEGVKG